MGEAKKAAAGPEAIKILVGSRELRKCSFTWRIWARATSFYIVPMLSARQDIKISLHGPDPRPGLKPGYKIALAQAMGGALARLSDWPQKQWFEGYEIHPGVDLVLRLRFPWDLFERHAVSAPPPPKPRSTEFAGLIPVPEEGRAVDVDIYVCHNEPYWPNEEQARQDNACLGPVINTAGQYLTAVVHHRSAAVDASPVTARAVAEGMAAPLFFDRLRGVSAAFDEREFLWVQEMWLPRSKMYPPSFSIYRPPSD